MMKGTTGHIRAFEQAREATPLVILDLRGNGGGFLDPAEELADLFLQSGPILSIERRAPAPRETRQAKSGTSPLESARLAVLVDGETASGAEAVAAAIQDNHRGTVIGNPTAGVARIRVVYEVAGGALSLTTARLLRANGEAIDHRGVIPDIVVDAHQESSAPSLVDAACPGFASPAPVAKDAAVAQAVAFLLSH
jgi:carboxyl-terminal processing protease